MKKSGNELKFSRDNLKSKRGLEDWFLTNCRKVENGMGKLVEIIIG